MTLFSWARHPMLRSLMENTNDWELNKSCLLSAVLDISKDPWVNAVTVWTWSSSSVEMVPPVLGLRGCKWIQVQVSNCSNVLPQGLWAVSEAQTDHVFVLPPLMTRCLERTFQSAHLLLAPSYQAVCELGHPDSYQPPTHKLGNQWQQVYPRAFPASHWGWKLTGPLSEEAIGKTPVSDQVAKIAEWAKQWLPKVLTSHCWLRQTHPRQQMRWCQVYAVAACEE